MNNEELLKKCIDLKCPYGVNYTHQTNKHITLREFLDGKEIEGLKEKYSSCKLRFKLATRPFPQYCFYKFRTGKLYNKDNKFIDRNNIENYEIGRDIKIIYDYDVENLKLQEYIDMMKNLKELYTFRHKIIIDYNHDPIYVLFGENGVLVFNDLGMVEEDEYYYKYPILSVDLLPD